MSDYPIEKLTLETLVAKQQEAKQNLDAWKALESQYRDEIARRKIEEGKTNIGTNNFDLGRGYKGKLVRKETITVTGTNDEVTAVEEILGDDISNLLFTWNVKMSKSIYDTLDPKNKATVNRVLTIKEAKPTFSVTAPKA